MVTSDSPDSEDFVNSEGVKSEVFSSSCLPQPEKREATLAAHIAKILGGTENQNSPLSSEEILQKLLLSLPPEQQISLLQSLDSNVLLAALQKRMEGKTTVGTSKANEVASEDNRRSPRRRVLLGARIIYNGGLCVISCHVRDISETGCRLKVSSTAAVPSRFRLDFLEGGISKECEVSWRKEDSMGVHFV